MRENVSSTTVTPNRRHERTRFTPDEVVSALQTIGGMSPIELLTAGYINIPAVNDDTRTAAASRDRLFSMFAEHDFGPVV